MHPTRPVETALEELQRWAAAHQVEVVQLRAAGAERQVAPLGELSVCDLVVAVGGDGTVLRALHAAAATHTPVLGVECGSLAALTTVPVSSLWEVLDSFAAGEWIRRRLPALAVRTPHGDVTYALNDLVLVRRGATQLIVQLWVNDDLYVRSAGDGMVLATPLGSSAYSMACGGPLLAAGTRAFLCTPIAMHGGSAPPLVVPDDREVTVEVDPGFASFDVQVDGRRIDCTDTVFKVSTEDGYATLVAVGQPEQGFGRLRGRGLIADSPRVLARDGRGVAPAGGDG